MTAASGRRGFITGGSWCVDRNKMVDFWPQEDSISEILSEERGHGGSGSNLAVDIKKLDPEMPVETIGIVGDDDDGRFLLGLADRHGIGRSGMTISNEAPTQYTDCYGSKRSGRRTHMTFKGVANLLSPDHFDFTQTNASIAHLGLPGIHQVLDSPWQGEANGWVAVLKKAKAVGLLTNIELVSIAPEQIAALARPCLPYLDLLVVNDHEIGAVAGLTTITPEGTDVEACIEAARRAMAAGAMQMVAVHFPRGAVLVARDAAPIRQPSLQIPEAEIAAANGAGDAFAAGFLYGFHEGWKPADCLALAHATAGASLRGLSTSGTVETWQRCLNLASGWGPGTPI